MKHFHLLFALLAASAISSTTTAQTPEVIYSKIAASPSGDVPGALDLAGMPAATQWRAIEDFAVSHDGSYWMVKGRTQLGSDLETILVRGSGIAGTMFAQEGQPVAGGASGELYDFFDSGDPVSWDTANNMGFSFRAKNGVANTLEKVVHYDDTTGTHTIVFQQSDLYIGAVDNPPGASGDEQVGNSVGSVNLLDGGMTIAFVNTPIQNCHSTRYPGFGRGLTMWKQSGITGITTFNGADVWDTFNLSDCGTTPDGLHWFIEGEVELEPAGSDKIFVVDDVIVFQESFPVVTGGPVCVDIFQTRMVSNGEWIARGDDPADDDWVVHNGNLILKTGDPVAGGLVGNVIGAVACNRLGDWVATCNTTNPDPAANEVLLYNGVVVMREGDPIDVDGNGMFDDGAFIGRANNTLAAFAANDAYLTDDRTLYAVIQLHDGLGNDLNTTTGGTFGTPDAFVRMSVQVLTFCDASDGSLASCPCSNPGLPDAGCDIQQGTGGVALQVLAQSITPRNRATLQGSGYPSANSPTAALIRSASLDSASPVVFGDGLRCVATPLVRLTSTFASGGISTHEIGHGIAGGTYFYQLWFRNQPAMYCTPDAFNMSSGRALTW